MNRLTSLRMALDKLVRDTSRDTVQLAKALWQWYQGLPKLWRIVLAVALLVLVIGGFAFARSSGPKAESNTLRTVTLKSVNEIGSGGAGGTVVGTVRSVQEAQILAKTGGTVQSVNTSLGANVPAGFVIASLENAAERAAVLQAEGAYDSAVAARSATSLSEETTGGRNAYQRAYTSLDTTIENDIDLFFGVPTSVGPDLTINAPGDTSNALSQERYELTREMRAWQAKLDEASAADPEILLIEADRIARTVSDFLTRLAAAANRRDSGATATQLAGLASARATVDGVLSSLSLARSAFRSGEVGATAGADAAVKSALGALRAAQARLEDTVIRAPIAGTVNFLPLQRGAYVTTLSHVATVAQNNALEVIAYVSESDRANLSVGATVVVQDEHDGLITAIAPALDPVTKQIEVRIAVDAASGLVNGESVRIRLPGVVATSETETVVGPILLPLSSVKLRAEDRVVFTIDADSRLVAVPVQTGIVRGAKIEITAGLDPALRIVVDARGLAEGERVKAAE